MTTEPTDAYPGASLGLPEHGRGSLATWRARVAALALGWAACKAGAPAVVRGWGLGAAVALSGVGVLRESGWRAWMVLAVYFVESTVLTALTGSSFGQLITRIGIARLDGQRLGWPRAIARAAMISVVLPTIVIGAERRALNDLLLGTVVVNLRASPR